jgi:very-short-patch-repair endonuclease
MRREPTDAERKLWQILRGRRFAGFKSRRQYPICGYILDFYCVRAKLAVELDGSQHGEPEGQDYDARRTQRLSEAGVRIVRFADWELLKNQRAVEDTLYGVLSQREPSP